MIDNIKKRRIIWIIMLIVGILPFAITLLTGIISAVTGIYDEMCILCNRELVYGIEAFMTVMIFAIYLFWPAYIIAAIIILVAVIRLVYLQKKVKLINHDI